MREREPLRSAIYHSTAQGTPTRSLALPYLERGQASKDAKLTTYLLNIHLDVRHALRQCPPWTFDDHFPGFDGHCDSLGDREGLDGRYVLHAARRGMDWHDKRQNGMDRGSPEPPGILIVALPE